MRALRIMAWALAIACAGCSTVRKTDYVVTDKPIGHPIAGFGACMNPYLYAYPNTPDEINPAAMADLEAKVKALRPQFVRIFFLSSWWENDTDESIAKNHPGMRQSLLRTIRLAQDGGATVLLQFWYDPQRYEDPDDVARRFAQAIADMRQQHGLTAIRYASIQNEPNEFSDDITMSKYVRVYCAFDRALRDLGIRSEVKIIGGDLVGEHQKHWFEMLAKDLSPVLDGYSIHVYWDYWDIEKFRRHVRDVTDILDRMPASRRRPIYVTEFGAQGFRDRPQIEPGKSDDGRPLCDVPVYGFEIGIFMLEAINAGFIGTAQWDMYEVWYDRKMGYGVIGSVQNKFPLKPSFWLLKMFTHAASPGWRAVRIDGEIEDVWVAALRGKTREQLSVFVLNRIHADKQVTLSGLPPHRPLKVWMWNGDGNGTLKSVDPISADADGVVSVTVPEKAIALLTSN